MTLKGNKKFKNPIAANKSIPLSFLLFKSLGQNSSVFQNLCQQMASLYYARYVLCTCCIVCFKSLSIISVHVNDCFILRSITSMLAIGHVGKQMLYHKRKRPF